MHTAASLFRRKLQPGASGGTHAASSHETALADSTTRGFDIAMLKVAHTQTQLDHSGTFAGSTSLLTAVWGAMRLWRARRNAIRDLSELDDRSLADIGIDRTEIESVIMTNARDRIVRL